MKKKIRSISIAENMDSQLKEDSNYRGLTISANVSRILYDYFQEQPQRTNRVLEVKRK